MTTIESSPNIGRSIAAIVAGLLVGALLSLGMDAILHATGVYPPWGKPMSDSLFAVATVYRLLFNVLGCYVAGRLAPRRPMKHALILGVTGFFLSVAGAAATWNRGPEFGPHWYPLALIITAIPCAWLGGWIGERQGASRHVKSSAASM